MILSLTLADRLIKRAWQYKICRYPDIHCCSQGMISGLDVSRAVFVASYLKEMDKQRSRAKPNNYFLLSSMTPIVMVYSACCLALQGFTEISTSKDLKFLGFPGQLQG